MYVCVSEERERERERENWSVCRFGVCDNWSVCTEAGVCVAAMVRGHALLQIASE